MLVAMGVNTHGLCCMLELTMNEHEKVGTRIISKGNSEYPSNLDLKECSCHRGKLRTAISRLKFHL